jgi:hypothetical protein
MPKGLPDSITYTMGKRIMRTATRGERRAQDSLDNNGAVLGGFLVGIMYVLVAPLMVAQWFENKRNTKRANAERKVRYQTAVARRKAQR